MARGRKFIDWSDEAKEKLGTMPDSELATQLGLCTATVRSARLRLLGAPAFDKYSTVKAAIENELGTISDAELSRKYGIPAAAVSHIRKSKGIQAFDKYKHAGLGQQTDEDVAKRLGVSHSTIAHARHVRGVAAKQKQLRWTPEHIQMLGTMPDSEVAKKTSRSKSAVFSARRDRRIKAFAVEK